MTRHPSANCRQDFKMHGMFLPMRTQYSYPWTVLLYLYEPFPHITRRFGGAWFQSYGSLFRGYVSNASHKGRTTVDIAAPMLPPSKDHRCTQ